MKQTILILSFLLYPISGKAQTNTFCASNLPCTVTAPWTFSADLLTKSGRPFFDVMAFGAKNDGVTDDTTAVQAAITAACVSTQGPGGTIFFPPGKTVSAAYFFAGTSSPIVVTCDNLEFRGTSIPSYIFSSSGIGNSVLLAPNLVNTAIITTSGTRFGLAIKNLSFKGHGASPANIQAINITANAVIKENNFYNFGGAAITTAAAGSASVTLEDNIIVGCLMGQAGGGVDIGCISLASADTQAKKNYVSIGLTDATGQLGTGHRYGWLVSGGTGFFDSNLSELNEQGFLNTGLGNIYINNRTLFNQGNGFVNRGSAAVYVANRSIDNGQNANNTFAGFSTNGTGSNSTYLGNLCMPNGGVVQQSNCFDDSNSNGGTLNVVQNYYSSNRAQSSALAGSLYNFTGTVPPKVIQPVGQETQTTSTGNINLQAWLNGEQQFFNTALIGNVTVTLSTTGAWQGLTFRITRGAGSTGGSTLTACGKALATSQWVDCQFFGGAWNEVASGSL